MQQEIAQYSVQNGAALILPGPDSSITGIDHHNMFLGEDLPLPFRRKLTVTGVLSLVLGLLLFGFGLGMSFDNNSIAFTYVAFPGGGVSWYAGILCIVLCRQQIYVLKSLFTVVIVHLLTLLVTLIADVMIFSYFLTECRSSDDYCDDHRRSYHQTKIFAILAIISPILLLLATIFNLVIITKEWRARRRVEHNSNSRNSYLLLNIPLSLRGNLRKTGVAYIALGGLIISLDIFLTSNNPVSFFTGLVSGFFSIVYGIVLIVLSTKRIYVLISLFCLALWQLLCLSVTFSMICFGLKYFNNRHEESFIHSRWEKANKIAIGLLVVVIISMIMTVVNMYFIMRGRRRNQQCSELSQIPMVLSYTNPINDKS